MINYFYQEIPLIKWPNTSDPDTVHSVNLHTLTKSLWSWVMLFCVP